MKMLRYQGRKNTDEASRMKCKRCKTQDVAYQDEKRRMQQIGAGKSLTQKLCNGHLKVIMDLAGESDLRNYVGI